MKNDMKNNIKKGDIFWCELPEPVGSEQGGKRPVVIIQNNIGNKYSPTTIIAVITTKLNKAKLPTHFKIENCNLPKESQILMEQIYTIDKIRLSDYIGSIEPNSLNKFLKISLGFEVIK